MITGLHGLILLLALDKPTNRKCDILKIEKKTILKKIKNTFSEKTVHDNCLSFYLNNNQTKYII